MTNSLTPETTLYLFKLLTDYYQNINSIEDYFRIKKHEKLLQYGI
jgi:hypothetical protein